MRIVTYSIGLNRGTQPETPYQLSDTLEEIGNLPGERVVHIGITGGSWKGVQERSVQVKVVFDDENHRRRAALGHVWSPRISDPQDYVWHEAGVVARRLGQECIAVHFNGSSNWVLCYGDNEHLDGDRNVIGCLIRDNPLIEGNAHHVKALDNPWNS